MLIVPVQALPNQTLQSQLGGQAIILAIYQTTFGLFMDVTNNGVLTIAGVICENGNRIVRDVYLGLIGDFAWFDTQGTNDPIYIGLGSRYVLIYLEDADIEAFEKGEVIENP